MSQLQRQVAAFHRLHNVPIVLAGPAVPEDEKIIRLRASLIAEELFEVMKAFFGDRQELHIAKKLVGDAIATKIPRVSLPELADGFADLDYVVEGSRLAFGIDGDPVAAEVHRANMEKVGGQVRSDGKILKPKQWTPPDIERVLREQGDSLRRVLSDDSGSA